MMEYTKRQEMLYEAGVRLLRENGTASCVLFQRMLSVGYAEAREIFDRILAEGIAVLDRRHTLVLKKKEEKHEI